MRKIHYISQLKYAQLSYPTTMQIGEPLREPYPSVAEAGCGLCCACMLVEALTGERLTVEACIELSVSAGANTYGTDMMRLGKAVSEKYGLEMRTGSASAQLGECLERGGCAVIHAGRTDGLFSKGGHYLLAVRRTGEMVWVLDPSDRDEKYSEAKKRGEVEQRGKYILVDMGVIECECRNRDPSFYMFLKGGNLL